RPRRIATAVRGLSWHGRERHSPRSRGRPGAVARWAGHGPVPTDPVGPAPLPGGRRARVVVITQASVVPRSRFPVAAAYNHGFRTFRGLVSTLDDSSLSGITGR